MPFTPGELAEAASALIPRIPQVVLLSSGPYASQDAAATDYELCYSVRTEVDTLTSTTSVTNYLFNGTPDQVDAFVAVQASGTLFGRFDITWSHTPIGHYSGRRRIHAGNTHRGRRDRVRRAAKAIVGVRPGAGFAGPTSRSPTRPTRPRPATSRTP